MIFCKKFSQNLILATLALSVGMSNANQQNEDNEKASEKGTRSSPRWGVPEYKLVPFKMEVSSVNVFYDDISYVFNSNIGVEDLIPANATNAYQTGQVLSFTVKVKGYLSVYDNLLNTPGQIHVPFGETNTTQKSFAMQWYGPGSRTDEPVYLKASWGTTLMLVSNDQPQYVAQIQLVSTDFKWDSQPSEDGYIYGRLPMDFDFAPVLFSKDNVLQPAEVHGGFMTGRTRVGEISVRIPIIAHSNENVSKKDVVREMSFPVLIPPSESMVISLSEGQHEQTIKVELLPNEEILFRYGVQPDYTDFWMFLGSERYLNGHLNGVSMYRGGLFSSYCVTFINGVAEGPYCGLYNGQRYRGVMKKGKINDGVSWGFSHTEMRPEILVYSNAVVVNRTYDIAQISKAFDDSEIPRLEFDLNSSQLSAAYSKMADGDGNSALLLYKQSCFLTNKKLLSDLLLTVSALLGNREGDQIYKTLSGEKRIHLTFSKNSLLALHDNDQASYLQILDFAQKIDLDDYAAAEDTVRSLEAKDINAMFISELKKIIRNKGDYRSKEEWIKLAEDAAKQFDTD